MTCPRCGDAARCVGWRDKGVTCLLGWMQLKRHYYHCDSCGKGHCPWDETLRTLGYRLTPAAREVVCLTGIQESFGKAADRTLHKLTGIHLSESTVERTTESAGTWLKEQQEKGILLGESQRYDWNLDAEGTSCAYVSLDLTGILMQGEGASKVDGRMVTVAMLYNPQPRQRDEEALSKPCDGVRYFAGFYDLEELGLQMRRQAGQVGMNDAQQWIALTDGGAGLERFIDVNFPRAEKILDFHHAAEHLSAFAKCYRPGPASGPLLDAWCHSLKHAGGKQVIRMLERLPRQKMADDVQEEYDRLLNYMKNNEHRMDYPRYLKRGWQIGSGAIESACKRVINQRLCMGGMRWGEEGSDAVSHLRALYQSDADQWDGFWALAA
jgi:hypothetical protein